MLEHRDVPVSTAGDMNDSPEAVTTTVLAGPEDGDPERPDKGDPVRLYNLADRIPSQRRYSRIYRGRGELIDHIFVSRPLLLAGVTADALVAGGDHRVTGGKREGRGPGPGLCHCTDQLVIHHS